VSDPNNRIESINVADEMSKSFLDYSMSVIISRALPDVRDGLKPSQRRILYAMSELSLWPNKKPYKCAKICGDTSGNYHPHGEAVIYPTLVHMAQPWAMRDTLIEGQGNFGSMDGDTAAAMRYTEARLTHLGTALLDDMDKDTVDFVPNYDERLTEPTVFPAAFPNLIVNGGTGIAVGMATNLAPHNLGEVVDGICAQIDNPAITGMELMEYIKGPDFPTGGFILGKTGIIQYMTTGRGQVRVRGKVEIEEADSGREQIVVTEVPYNTNRATLMIRIGELANEKVLPEISAVRDECSETTRIVIELKKDARAQVVVNNLYKYTALGGSFSVNMLAIDNRRPRLLTMKDAISCYIEHRREVVLRRTKYLLRKAEDRAEILEALLLSSSQIDDFIKMIRDSKDRAEAEAKIKAYHFTEAAALGLGVVMHSQPHFRNGNYYFSDRQVKAIVELQLYKLTSLERHKVKEEYDAVMLEIADYMDIIANESRVMAIIKEELLAIKAKHATPRLTQIIADDSDINTIDLIANEAQIITITHRGYIKRTITSQFRSQRRGGKGMKGMATREAQHDDEVDDFVEHMFSASSHDYLMFFTNSGRVYVERVFQIPEADRTGKGRSIKNLLNLRPEEKIASVLRVAAEGESDKDVTFSDDKFVIFGTKNGVVKRTNLSQYRNFRKDGIIAITIQEGDFLIGCLLTSGRDEIVFVTHEGYSLRLKEYAESAGTADAADPSDVTDPTDSSDEEPDAEDAESEGDTEDPEAEGGEGEDEGEGKSKGGLRSMGRQAKGVRGIKLRKGDYVVSLTIVEAGAMLLVASENGLGKRSSFDSYRIQSRGGKGIITMKTTEKAGKVIGALVVHDEDELMLMTTSGQSVRIPVNQIRETGRNAQGVKLLTLKGGEQLRDIAKVISDKDEAEETEADTLEATEGEVSEVTDSTDDSASAPDTGTEDSADESSES
jgi:DNA gyrase subunit A